MRHWETLSTEGARWGKVSPRRPGKSAPSMVPIMHQVSSTMKSITLSWPQPEQPNGIILDYELCYYEKSCSVGCTQHALLCRCLSPWGVGAAEHSVALRNTLAISAFYFSCAGNML
ncbi:hypothetical protein P4O66_002400 [Electrophorus voltai]|uniref:Fibronectin type-III domain-containing protein n=1 Tax=Electrophorus voltai TaxID=2609070 RepID=A0AAD8YZB3_9TELE|nr:hypothetical protein P4O66_002400 [Electrophorus voltai]